MTLPAPKPYKMANGFTFIELTVVIFLIGLTLVLTLPKIRHGLFTDGLKTTVRRMEGKIWELRNTAVRERKAFMLRLDLESGQYWWEWPKMKEKERQDAKERAVQLPEGVRILDVWRQGTGKKAGGESTIHFTKKGYVEPSVIHLEADDGRQFTLILNPFLPKVQVIDKYVDFA